VKAIPVAVLKEIMKNNQFFVEQVYKAATIYFVRHHPGLVKDILIKIAIKFFSFISNYFKQSK
jgi:hypothetical protein